MVEGEGWELPIPIGKHSVKRVSLGSVGTGMDIFLEKDPIEKIHIMDMFGGKTIDKRKLDDLIRRYDKINGGFGQLSLAAMASDRRIDDVMSFLKNPGTRPTAPAEVLRHRRARPQVRGA